MKNFMTADEVKEKIEKERFLCLKYVRLENDEFRFCQIMQDHSSVVADGEKAISAGIIGIKKNSFKFTSTGSMTLKLSGKRCHEDEEFLEKLLNMKYGE